jgi:nitrate reductase NapE component
MNDTSPIRQSLEFAASRAGHNRPGRSREIGVFFAITLGLIPVLVALVTLLVSASK